MNLTIISDTHGEHRKLDRFSEDVLIQCGDMFNMFGAGVDDLERMDEWFGEQDFELILCIGGNHDFPPGRACAAGRTSLILSARLRDVAPRIHCFGHVHASSGTSKTARTTAPHGGNSWSRRSLGRRTSFCPRVRSGAALAREHCSADRRHASRLRGRLADDG